MVSFNISNKRQRDIQRAVHLLAAVVLVGFVYGPLGGMPAARMLVQVAVLPLLVVTGLLLWQLPRLRSRLKRARTGTSGT